MEKKVERPNLIPVCKEEGESGENMSKSSGGGDDVTIVTHACVDLQQTLTDEVKEHATNVVAGSSSSVSVSAAQLGFSCVPEASGRSFSVPATAQTSEEFSSYFELMQNLASLKSQRERMKTGRSPARFRRVPFCQDEITELRQRLQLLKRRRANLDSPSTSDEEEADAQEELEEQFAAMHVKSDDAGKQGLQGIPTESQCQDGQKEDDDDKKISLCAGNKDNQVKRDV